MPYGFDRADAAMEEQEVMSRWIKMADYFNGRNVVHQIRCPKCKHTETYIGIAPDECYVCEERRRL